MVSHSSEIRFERIPCDLSLSVLFLNDEHHNTEHMCVVSDLHNQSRLYRGRFQVLSSGSSKKYLDQDIFDIYTVSLFRSDEAGAEVETYKKRVLYLYRVLIKKIVNLTK